MLRLIHSFNHSFDLSNYTSYNLCSTDPNLCEACVLVYCKMSYSEYANHTQTQLINTLFNVIQASLGNVVAQRGPNLSVKRELLIFVTEALPSYATHFKTQGIATMLRIIFKAM